MDITRRLHISHQRLHFHPFWLVSWSWHYDESLLRSSLISFLCVSYHLWCSGASFMDSSGSYPPLLASGSSCSRWSCLIWPPLAWFSGCQSHSRASAWRVWLELLLCCSSASLEYSCSPRICWSNFICSLFFFLKYLFSLLFTGLLINRESVLPALRWLYTVSFFHAAFEALAVNELRYLQLKEIKVRCFSSFRKYSTTNDGLYLPTSVWCRARRPGCYYSLCVRTQGSGSLSTPFLIIQWSLNFFFFLLGSRSGGRTSHYWAFSLCYSQRQAISLFITSWRRSVRNAGLKLGLLVYIYYIVHGKRLEDLVLSMVQDEEGPFFAHFVYP